MSDGKRMVENKRREFAAGDGKKNLTGAETQHTDRHALFVFNNI